MRVWSGLVCAAYSSAIGAAPSTDAAMFDDVVLVGDAHGYWCSGVVADRRHVLTAKHCSHATRIGIGASVETARGIAVTAHTDHPSLDVAVLTLASDVTVAVHPRRGAQMTDAPTARVTTVGFGVTDQLSLNDFGTRHARAVLAEGWGCDLLRAADLGCRPRVELLLRGGRLNDTCFGDSGGGVFEPYHGNWRLLGITSRGTKPKRILCGEGGIYVRADAIASWLAESLKT